VDAFSESNFTDKKNGIHFMKQIIIDPNIDIQYSAFYIHGLRQVFGMKNVRFAAKSQIGLFSSSGTNVFSFIVYKKNRKPEYTKVAIDYADFNYILDKETYNWADIYGKINTNWKKTPADQYPKIVCLASNFGIRCFSYFESLIFSLSNYVKIRPSKKKKFFAQYYKQNKKLWLKDYLASKPENNYIFSANTLWHSDEWNRLDETTNKIRADFMDICLSLPHMEFEGGFLPSLLGNENHKHLQLIHTFSHREYIDKLRKSILAFNTPAVWNCHGWKLSEFLCLGKAIISTPLSNDLPAPMIHGESVHFIKDMSELPDAILLLNENKEYRSRLEKGAREYYEKYVSPAAVIKLLGF
jgi:glycosyltransferase involved in cell wall biosynthesis